MAGLVVSNKMFYPMCNVKLFWTNANKFPYFSQWAKFLNDSKLCNVTHFYQGRRTRRWSLMAKDCMSALVFSTNYVFLWCTRFSLLLKAISMRIGIFSLFSIFCKDTFHKLLKRWVFLVNLDTAKCCVIAFPSHLPSFMIREIKRKRILCQILKKWNDL